MENNNNCDASSQASANRCTDTDDSINIINGHSYINKSSRKINQKQKKRKDHSNTILLATVRVVIAYLLTWIIMIQLIKHLLSPMKIL